jgi:mannose-1-phosphate guanylyltransferase/phosphomannomutase
VDLAPDAIVEPPVYLGEGVGIKAGVVLKGPSSISEYSVIDSRAHVDRSIVWRNCYIGEDAELRGAMVGQQSSIKRHAVLFEGVVVGDACVVGQEAIIHPDVKIWPQKEVVAGATVKNSIIWGSQGRKVLFGRFGVTGLVNTDLTPEVAARLGAAFGATLPVGSRVVVNRDPHRSPRMIKRGMISGLPSAGVNAWDTRSVPIPVARFYTRVTDCVGGVNVRLSPFDRRVVDIRFFDADGLNLRKAREREIERVYFREDFRRVFLDDLGTISYAPRVLETYSEAFLNALDMESIRGRSFRIVIDYANAPTAQVLPHLLDTLGIDTIAINAHLDETRMSIPRAELSEGLDRLTRIAQAVGADLGARLDVGGEKLFVVDDSGRLLNDSQLAAVLAHMIWRGRPGSTIAVPVHAPHTFERLASEVGGKVTRTSMDISDVMRSATRAGTVLACDLAGSMAIPGLHPAVDGMFALAKLLECLAGLDVALSDELDSLPPWYTAARSMPCAWEERGTVMRRLNEQYRTDGDARIDGVRVTLGDEWVLILPDPDKPVLRVFAESASPDRADTLAAKYVNIVEGLKA